MRIVYDRHIFVPLLSDALGVVLGWICSIFLISIILDIISHMMPLSDGKMKQLLVSVILSSVVALRLVYSASQRFSAKGFMFNMGLSREGRPFYQVVFLPAVLGIVFAYFSSSIVFKRQVAPDTPLNDIIKSTQSSELFVLFLIIAVFFAPLVEEIIFRGYFFYVIDKEKGRLPAIFIVSTVFAMLHVGQYWGDWQAIFMVALLGCALTTLRAITARTLASVVMHYTYNAGIVLMSFVMGVLKNIVQ